MNLQIRHEELLYYRWMRTARCIDDVERELVARAEAFFQVSAAGHEASAMLAPHLSPQDYLHCHYRDKALMLARGIPISEFFDSLVCNVASHSAGRQMSAHLSAPHHRVLSIVGPVGNNALQAAGIAQELKTRAGDPMVLCSMGDGATQQGEVLEAVAEAARSTLPILFLIHDNKLSISTATIGQTFFSLPEGRADSFYGIPITYVDGSDAVSASAAFGTLVERIRTSRSPQICVLDAERLSSHTNADDDFVYRDLRSLARARDIADPIRKLRRLLSSGLIDLSSELDALDKAIEDEVRVAAEAALLKPQPLAERRSRLRLPMPLTERSAEIRGSPSQGGLTMTEAFRETLRERMRLDPRVTLYGEDIEDLKGDVFGVTRGLSTAFPGRVRNSPLSESTIVGTSIGRALAGGRPVAFLQFADFLPLAFNQVATELASMHWRTQGQWRAPVILMVTCGGYRPGLGPFHAHTFEAIVAHLPGMDVAMPATASDAAGALNAAFRSERPTVIFYPKSLLNDRARTTSPDVARQFIPVGAARVVREGTELTLVGWGSTAPICESVASALDLAKVSTEVIDLRWLAPWDRRAVLKSVGKTRRLLVVHEDNRTVGFGAEILATVAESSTERVECRRVTRPDTFVPCHYENQLDVLPSFERTLEAASEMLSLQLHWESSDAEDSTQQVVPLIGSSPSDQTVELTEIRVVVGERVAAGQIIASLEADKAIVDLASPADGVVTRVHLAQGEKQAVGTPLLTLAVSTPPRRQAAKLARIPRLERRSPKTSGRPSPTNPQTVVLTGLGVSRGRERLDNSALRLRFASLAAQDDEDVILNRTGIESRLVADSSQTTVSMGVEAATQALREAGITGRDLSLVICCTTTPELIVPSTACRILHQIAPDTDVIAYDIQAACSGYLYGLSNAWDHIQRFPDAKVMLVTTELMRRAVEIDDVDTSPIFADAATATVLTGPDAARGLARVARPVLGARGEDGTTLRVPPLGAGHVRMQGRPIFAEAVRRMIAMLTKACENARMSIEDLDLIVPHQANGRIIEAMRARLRLPAEKILDEIRYHGNTSSSSIPLALNSILRREASPARIGLCAFGGGYTFGGALLETGGAPPCDD